MKKRNQWILLVLFGLCIVGCVPKQSDEGSALPADAEMPIAEGVATWKPLQAPYDLPYPQVAIRPENVSSVVELARLGKGEITDFAWSPDGEKLAVAFSGGIFLYHWSSLEEMGNIHSGNHVSAIAFSPDGKMLASMSEREKNLVRLWGVADGRVIRILDLGDHAVVSLAFSPDGQMLALGLMSGTIQLWQVTDGNLMRAWAAHPQWHVAKLAFSPDGELLASTSRYHIKLWRVADGSQALLLEEKSVWEMGEVAFSPDGATLASVSSRGLLLWRVSDGRQVQTEIPEWVNGIAFSPDGQLLAYRSWEGISLWSMSDGNLAGTLKTPHGVNRHSFSPDGRALATLSSTREENAIRFWNVADGREIGVLEGQPPGLKQIAFSPDGQILASASYDKIELQRVMDGSLMHTLKYDAWGIAFSQDGQTLVSKGHDCFWFNVTLWRVSDGSFLRMLEFDHPPSSSFSPPILLGSLIQVANLKKAPSCQLFSSLSGDGEILALGGWRTIMLWRISDGSLISTIRMKREVGAWVGLAFTPDGQTLASSSWDYTIKLWRVSDGRLLRTFRGHSNYVDLLAFSPDGQRLASGTDNTIKLWRVSDGRLLRTLKAGDYNVSSLAFSPDGQLLAAASEDGIRLWRTSDGSLLRILKGESGEAGYIIAFSPDGRWLASSRADGTICLWGVLP